MNRFQKSVLAAGILLAAPLVPLRAEDQISQPTWLKLPHVAEDITFVPEFDPRLAEGPEVEALRSKLRGVAGLWLVDTPAKLASFIEQVDNSSMVVVAKEKLLLEAVSYWQSNVDPDALPILSQLSERKPRATYLAPGCREDEEHLLFDYASAARLAIHNTEWSMGAGEYQYLEPTLSKQTNPLARILEREFSTARLSGALYVMLEDHLDQYDHIVSVSNPQSMWHELATSPESLEKAPPASQALLLDYMQKQPGEEGAVQPAVELAIHASDSLAVLALAEVSTSSHVTFNEATIETLIDLSSSSRSELVRVRALACLSGHRIPEHSLNVVSQELIGTLGDPSLGTEAAMAASSNATATNESAAQLAVPSDPVTTKNCILVLMNANDSASRAALASFASATSSTDTPELQRLRRKVSQWLAQTK